MEGGGHPPVATEKRAGGERQIRRAETREHSDALMYTEEDDAMRRVLHHDLMRGHKAQRAAIILLMGLLLVLVAAFVHGVSLLRA